MKLTVVGFEFHSDFLADEDRQWLEIEASIDSISLKGNTQLDSVKIMNEKRGCKKVERF